MTITIRNSHKQVDETGFKPQSQCLI